MNTVQLLPPSQNLIGLRLSAKDLTLKLGSSAAALTIEVINHSDRFASFQVELTAAGCDGQGVSSWYSLSPEVCSKKPPGDTTAFQVQIINAPIAEFVGLVNITVRVFSVELRAEERQVLRLLVEPGVGAIPLRVQLDRPELQSLPGSGLDVWVEVFNRSPHTLITPVQLVGLPDWLVDAEPQRLSILSDGCQKIAFYLQIPADTPTQCYPFRVEALALDNTWVSESGKLHILPAGTVQLSCVQPQQRIPTQRAWLPGRRWGTANYSLSLANQSNQLQRVSLKLTQPPAVNRPLCQLTLPDPVRLNLADTQPVMLTARADRPWIGMPHVLPLDLSASLMDSDLVLEGDRQTLELKLFPVMPRWLQGLLLLLCLAGLWGLWQIYMQGSQHQSAVNSVRWSGLANQVISGSNDQTVRRWQVQGDRLVSAALPIQFEKAVRTVRFRPVDNNRLAAGLENGEIQLWDILSSRESPVAIFLHQPDDRVLALAFTDDSQSLFSGHGSGRVLRWSVAPTSSSTAQEPLQKTALDFAVYDLALVGTQQHSLAIGGRYNQLVLWHWFADRTTPKPTLQPLPYPTGGQDDYITSLSVAQQQPTLLATADTQGRLSLWDLSACLSGTGNCELLDQWTNGHKGQPIRSVALSANGCYLTSAGDDGRVMLWPLTNTGQRLSEARDGQVIADLNTHLNSVDLQALQSDLLITTGSDDRQVRLFRLEQPMPNCH